MIRCPAAYPSLISSRRYPSRGEQELLYTTLPPVDRGETPCAHIAAAS
jgi:hypothetical protein